MKRQNQLFPEFTPRIRQQKKIEKLIACVQEDGRARAALIYGEGGTGKSYFLRYLPLTVKKTKITWIGPLDIDDEEFWLLANLEGHIARCLSEYFPEYLNYISKMPTYEKRQIDHETVLAYLRRGDNIFVHEYEAYLQLTGQTPVIILDTMEAIRGTELVFLIANWMRNLPGTLFILAGRPIHAAHETDPILEELQKEPRVETQVVPLLRFTKQESRQYINHSQIKEGLIPEEVEKLILITSGHPLWLAMSIYYLNHEGVPAEIKEFSLLQFKNMPPRELDQVREAYLRRLVMPYSALEFWHEAIMRLAVVRRRVSEEIWQELMSDRDRPCEVENWHDAWEVFLQIPWIRTRANKRYVTLHDALAEALAQRVIPAFDKSRDWRNRLWEKAVKTYDALISYQEPDLIHKKDWLNEELKSAAREMDYRPDLIEDVVKYDTKRREFHLLTAASLYYQMLYSYEDGCARFISLFDKAMQENEYHLAELLWLEMQRFLPGKSAYDPLEDVVRKEIARFQSWYAKNPDTQYEIKRRIAAFLSKSGNAIEAEFMLDELYNLVKGKLDREYEIYYLRGNARLYIAGKTHQAEDDFRRALNLTTHPDASSGLQEMRASALNELGYFYRITGYWGKAAEIYLDGLRLTPIRELRRRADLQSQYAYVEALCGRYPQAHDLVDPALDVRKTLGLKLEYGMSLSVKGEIYRYEREYQKAWDIFEKAEDVFNSVQDLGWLGQLWQQMAICLFQSSRAGKAIDGFSDSSEMLVKAKDLALDAVRACKDYRVHAYPSALNRAGRILGVGFGDYVQGLKYLDEGVSAAKQVMDGWFWLANLVEYVDLCFLAWEKTGDKIYLQQIHDRKSEIETVEKDFPFSDLSGRWYLLQGTMKSDEALRTSDELVRNQLYQQALEDFKLGYPLIAMGYVGSHGTAELDSEFKKLEDIIRLLPEELRESWLNELGDAWSQLDPALYQKDKQATSLLSLATKLYLNLHPQLAENA